MVLKASAEEPVFLDEDAASETESAANWTNACYRRRQRPNFNDAISS